MLMFRFHKKVHSELDHKDKAEVPLSFVVQHDVTNHIKPRRVPT